MAVKYLVDTSAYSLAARGEPKTAEIFRSAPRLFLTPVVRAELLNGFRLGSKTAQNVAQFAKFCRSSRVEMLSIDEATSDFYSAISLSLRAKGKPIPTNDIWIAASAMQFGLSVVTADAHFCLVDQITVCLISQKPTSEMESDG